MTVLFCDIVGSTALGGRLDPEAVRSIQNRYFSTAKRAIELHGGTVEKYVGDAVMAVFGVPLVHEDDALRALRAGLAIRTGLETLNEALTREFDVRLQVRIGVNSGEAVAGQSNTRQHLVSGDVVNLSARLEQHAAAGEVLVGPLTAELVGGLADLEAIPPLLVKGKAEAIGAFRLLGLSRATASFETQLIGRAAELTQVLGLFDEVVTRRRVQMCTVIGDPGVGKSELARAAVVSIGDRATVLVGHCLSYGEGITYWPIREIVCTAAGILEAHDPVQAMTALERLAAGSPDELWVAERVALATGLTDQGTASEVEFALAIRRLLANVAANGPVILLVDDIQWADPAMLALLRSLAQLEAPILLLALARPELAELQPDWPVSFALQPLMGDVVSDLATTRLGGPVSSELSDYLVHSSAGNPLFLRHLLDSLQQRRELQWVDDEWRLAVAGKRSTPSTLTALLTSRLEQLTQPEREALEAGAVEGERFHQAAITYLLAGPQVERALDRLRERTLIRPVAAELAASDAYAFQHLLLRDAAYSGLLLAKRSELHERFAEWLETVVSDRLAEFEPIVAVHLESAWAALEGLGLDVRRANLGRRAYDRLAVVARRALARGDVRGAVTLLARAMRIGDELDPAETDDTLAEVYGLALWEAGQVKEARNVLLRFTEDAERAGAELRVLHGRLDLAALDLYFSPELDVLQIEALARKAIPAFEKGGDVAGLSKAWEALSDVDWITCQFKRCGERAQLALQFARQANDPRRQIRVIASIAMSATVGPTPVRAALAEMSAILATTADHPETHAQVVSFASTLHAAAGDFDAARTAISGAIETFDHLGLRFKVAEFAQAAAVVEGYVGDWAMAEHKLREACVALEAIGEINILSTNQALLGESLWQQGRFEEAVTSAEQSRRSAAATDTMSQVLWRVVKAKSLASLRAAEEAAPLAFEARNLALGTDIPQLAWEAELAVGHVEAMRSQMDAAYRAYTAAAEVAQRKGNIVIAQRALNHAAATIADDQVTSR